MLVRSCNREIGIEVIEVLIRITRVQARINIGFVKKPDLIPEHLDPS